MTRLRFHAFSSPKYLPLVGCGIVLLACGTGAATGSSTDSAEQGIVPGSSPCEQVAIPIGNLVPDPSFESGVAAWYGWQASASALYLGSSSPNGSYVATIAYGGSGGEYSIGTASAVVRTLGAGQKYVGTAYVQAASPSAVGKPVTLILRERNASGATEKLWSSATVSLTASF